MPQQEGQSAGIESESQDMFPVCRSLMGSKTWGRITENTGSLGRTPEIVAKTLQDMSETMLFPEYLPEVARVECMRWQARESADLIPSEPDHYILNPTLDLIQTQWKVSQLFNDVPSRSPVVPVEGEEWVITWYDPEKGEAFVRQATEEELFVIKILAEDITIDSAADISNLRPGKVYQAVHACVDKGLVIGPPSSIRRTSSFAATTPPADLESPKQFVLQWHITHACDLHCKHCYDRSKRSPLTAEQGIKVLDDLSEFCRSKNVRGVVCFSGGNPFMYPHFEYLYSAAVEHGFATSILGNPVSRKEISRINDIHPPAYYQVSLEGLPEHNDSIRGTGNFAGVIEFLGVLRDLNISSAVMLTLTSENIDQVLPLAYRLRGHTDHFTFNRLAPVGEGANLLLPDAEKYRAFADEYVNQLGDNPLLACKDNLLNVARYEQDMSLFDGCTGFGCGAAFNFLALLPDGEVHACRKFPSPLGNVFEKTLQEIYDCDRATRYREGSQACTDCAMKYRCGGCMAVVHGTGGDVFENRDPMCCVAEV